jgi:hypothetical protein
VWYFVLKVLFPILRSGRIFIDSRGAVSEGEPMNNNNTRSRIHRMCTASKLDEKDLYDKAKLLLEIYRDVCWNTVEYVNDLREEFQEYDSDYCSGDMDDALIYLENFAPDEGKERFEERIKGLFETKWMIEIVDAAMIKVKDCPVNGELYFSLLSAYYLSKFSFTESEMLEEFGLERSSYYRRKKEAVTVFGLAVWGSSINELKREAMNTSNDSEQVRIKFTDGGEPLWIV